VTDALDGRIARANGLITNFGKFMDPVADKFMVIGTMMALLFRMMNPDIYGLSYNTYYLICFFVLLLMIVFREFAITSLRLVVVNVSGEVVAANILGKLKTITQIVCISSVMIEPLLDGIITYFLPDYFLHGIYPISLLSMVVALVFTVWSGINYLKAGWKYVSTDW
jgi:CDP-diacylglycerol--glycerol-3-phosphate 3-phosphatidyltransferase